MLNNSRTNEVANGAFDPFAAANSDLARRVALYIASCQRSALRDVSVQADQGVVRVRGKVRTFYEKQLVQQARLRVAGVTQLIDEVQVLDSRTGTGAWAESHLFDAWSNQMDLSI